MSSDKTKPGQVAKATTKDPAGRGEKPQDAEKLMYWWMPDDPDCPEDLVINAGSRSVIIGAPAFVERDSPRLDIGDRRQDPYYTRQIGGPSGLGLSKVKDLSIERIRELNKVRRIRTGEEPADWIKIARARAEAGDQVTNGDVRSLNPFQRAALGGE